jgi:transposase
MVSDGNIISGITDWCEESHISLVDKLTDQMCSCLFTYLDFNSRMNFFSNWIEHISENDYIVYDVTSISTYSQNILNAEFGYNRDEENLPQINFGMFYAKNSGLPIYYNEYQGSINDVSDLQFMLENTTYLGIKKVDFVLDKGFASEDNFKYMWENKFNFIIPIPSNWTHVKILLESNVVNVQEYSNWIHKYEVYGIKVSYKIDKIPIYAHIFFDTEKYHISKKSFNEKIQILEEKLKKFNTTKKIPKHYFDYFDIELKGNNNEQIQYSINNKKLNERSKYAGYFIYLTTNENYSPEELLKIYKTRDFIEKTFMNFKDNINFKRLRTHNKRTTSGKLFVGFISLILRTELLNRIKKCEQTSKLTVKDVIRKLKRIVITTINNNIVKKMPISKHQRNVFSSIGILLDEFFVSINKK